MIVAAGAGEGKAEKPIDRRRRHVVKFIKPQPQPLLFHRNCEKLRRCARDESGGRNRLRIFRLIFIPGQLPAHKRLIRKVVVKRSNDKVAIVISVRPIGVGFHPVAISIARYIEPVPRPALAIVRTRQDTLDKLVISIRRRIRDELIHLGRRWRQAEHVEINSADQRAPIGDGIGVQVLGVKSGENKPIDIRPRPRCIFDNRRIDAMKRQIRPMLAIFGRNHHLRSRGRTGALSLRPICSLLNPRSNQLNFSGAERVALWRHAVIRIGRGDATK